MPHESTFANARTVLISVNPRSGAGGKAAVVQQLVDELQARDFSVEVLSDLALVKQRTTELLRSGDLRFVVAAGGDGTVSLLANELPSETALAILPLGTENLLAKYLELTADGKRLAKLIDEGITVQLDAGSANGKLFLVMASCGFDADVVQRLHEGRTGNIRHWSYVKPILDALRQYRYPLIRLTLDGNPQSVTAKWAFVFNCPRYAMNLPIVHDADSGDGMLDLCTFGRGKLMRGLLYLSAIITGQHRRWKKNRVKRFRYLRIESDDSRKRVPYQLDGDPGGELPLEISVLPGRLKMLVFADWPHREKHQQKHQ
jgi:diacylglycerol kinase (ATP)